MLTTLAPLAVAILLWVVALPAIDPERMTDLGLVSVLPPLFFLALAVLGIGFCLAVFRREGATWVPAMYIGAWITVIHGTPAIVYGALRYAWAWKHVGVVDYIQRTGRIDPAIDNLPVYHNWPGFFGAAALLVEAAGLGDALTLANWSPLAFELLFAGAVLLIVRSATADWRLIWLAVWFFTLANWVGQDYFAPQAMTYLFYLVVVGICLWAFPARLQLGNHPIGRLICRWPLVARIVPALDRRIAHSLAAGRALPPLSIGQRRGLLLVAVLLLAAIAVSHQLTPFVAILALGALVIFGQCSARSLPVIMGVLTAAWLMTGAADFAAVGIREVVSTFGQAGENAGANLIDVSRFTPGVRIVSNMARALTAAVGLLAVLGWLRRLWAGYLDLPLTILWVVPVGLLAVSSYGGEILFRIYFFALPFMAFFLAALFVPISRDSRVLPPIAATAVVSGVLAVGFLFAYYGNEQSNHFRPGEVAAAEYLDEVAPDGALLVEVSPNYPSRYRRYEQYVHVPLVPWPRGNVDESENHYSRDDIIEMMADPDHPAAFLVITRGQLLALSVPGLASVEDVLAEIAGSARFTVLFENDDAIIYALAGREPGVSP